MNRDEIIAELVATYRAEISSLNDAELLDHWKTQKAISGMTPDEWQRIWTQVSKSHK